MPLKDQKTKISSSVNSVSKIVSVPPYTCIPEIVCGGFAGLSVTYPWERKQFLEFLSSTGEVLREC